MMLMMTANKRKCPQESVRVCDLRAREGTGQTASHKLIGNVALLYPLKYTKVSAVILSLPFPLAVAATGVTTLQRKMRDEKTKCHQRSHFLPSFVLSCITYSLWFGEMC